MRWAASAVGCTIQNYILCQYFLIKKTPKNPHVELSLLPLTVHMIEFCYIKQNTKSLLTIIMGTIMI